MTKAEIFLEKYKELENTAVSYLNLPPDGHAVAEIERRSEFSFLRSELSYCREVRNLLSHRAKIDHSYAVEPTDAMIALLERVIASIKKPVKLKDICVPRDRVLQVGAEDHVLWAMKIMRDKGFSHIPVTDGERVIGVFSKSTVFELVCSGEKELSPALTFEDIKELTGEQAHEESYVFMKESDTLEQAERISEELSKKRKRIGLFILTDDGTENGRLKGVLTPWDVLAAKPKR